MLEHNIEALVELFFNNDNCPDNILIVCFRSASMISSVTFLCNQLVKRQVSTSVLGRKPASHRDALHDPHWGTLTQPCPQTTPCLCHRINPGTVATCRVYRPRLGDGGRICPLGCPVPPPWLALLASPCYRWVVHVWDVYRMPCEDGCGKCHHL